MNNDIARFNMIEQQIRPWEVLDGAVLSLLSVVKRENFAPMAHKALAFVDMEIPLKDGNQTGQVMLPPRVEARLLQDADVKRTDKVLEVGTGSGYMAALLAHQAASVLSFELDATLAQQARTNLQAAGIHNVEVRQADGSQGAPSDGPFDVIMLSGSVPNVPQVLLNQLSIGGRLLAVVGEDPVMRASVITRTSDQQWQTSEPWDTMAPRLQGFPEHNRFSF
ncbi:protein-L-isoaspartate O-methyltransferase [Limnohabitans sp. MMS-10A-178]|uniref:protein-L-isoaspartate O-methyltransferase family protein n=1 Tax=Limnohabitans sp. MMS-10A-178 TaxID=1835767 RepID=UPI000D342BD0|nr:protein-L-isoaspartate O-methyltransferase [Limnohabitans sp. MMS-10A-178]PUE17067.1 protein-L-isoaspartate O-methyltransferase [Limnohabitans sp. MMS-10A-178]